MEDKNELSDILLDKDENKSMKAKRILVIAAVIIVLFLIVLVVMRLLNKPDERMDSEKLILPPSPMQKVVETKKEDDLFKQVPIIEEEDKKESFEEMVKSLKAKEIKKQEAIEMPAEVPEKVVEQTKPEIEKVIPIRKEPKVAEPIKTTKTVADTSATAGFYIQVGATSRLTPSKKFLAKLATKNYSYRLLPMEVKGKKVTKILVGPYPSSAAARAVLGDVKSSINKDAFIFRVK